MDTEILILLFGLGAAVVGGIFKTLRDDVKDLTRKLDHEIESRHKQSRADFRTRLRLASKIRELEQKDSGVSTGESRLSIVDEIVDLDSEDEGESSGK